MRVFGLIGHPLSHSWSAAFWNDAFARNSMTDCVYNNYDLSCINELPDLLKSNANIEGLNVTIPYKTDVLPLLHRIDPIAEAIGAVNTIHVQRGETIGYNTDAEGFRKSIRPFLETHHQKALILGSGGASRAVKYVLETLGIHVFVVSRQTEKGDLTYRMISESVVNNCKLIVNCTPVGMAGVSDESPIDPRGMSADHLIVDLIYNPSETQLMKDARSCGATALNGADMLRFQAEEAMRIFFGRVL